MFELACAVEIFALSRPEYKNWYQTDVICFDNANIQTTAGIRLTVKFVDDLSEYQTLVIPSWRTNNNHLKLDMIEKINIFAEQGKRIVSLCSGAFLLAQLGLLQNKRATTHCHYPLAL
jgi:AraC family transcriptional activator FtrA